MIFYNFIFLIQGSFPLKYKGCNSLKGRIKIKALINKIIKQISGSWHTPLGSSWACSYSRYRCWGALCFSNLPKFGQFFPYTRFFWRPDMLSHEWSTRVVFRGLTNQLYRLRRGLCLDNCALLCFLCLLDLVLRPFSFLLSHLLALISTDLPSIASRYSFPKVRSVMAKLSMMMLNWEALYPSRVLIFSETWSLWLNNWAAENWATTVLRISLQRAGSTFCS